MKLLTFRSLDLEIKLPAFVNIIGHISSERDSILKKLINRIPDNNIYFDNQPATSYSIDYKKKNIAVCLHEFNFRTEYVKEELLYYQEKIGLSIFSKFESLKNISRAFDLDEMLDSKIEYLTLSEKALIKILSLLIIKPKVLGIEDLLTYLELDVKIKIVKYAKENEISILNVTSNSEELLLGSHTAVFGSTGLILYNQTKKVLEEEKVLSSIGFSLPFIVSLSNGLNYYDILNKQYFDEKSLIGAIWK